MVRMEDEPHSHHAVMLAEPGSHPFHDAFGGVVRYTTQRGVFALVVAKAHQSHADCPDGRGPEPTRLARKERRTGRDLYRIALANRVGERVIGDDEALTGAVACMDPSVYIRIIPPGVRCGIRHHV